MIDRSWHPLPGEEAPDPANEEMWFVDVVRESSPGEARGCFVVRPIRRIAQAGPDGKWGRPLLYLVPGTFRIDVVTPVPGLKSVAVVTPDDSDGRDWVLSVDDVHTIMAIKGTYALVVNLGGAPWRASRPKADPRKETGHPAKISAEDP